MKKNELTKGSIYHINFSGNIGAEINNIHLGIIFPIPGLKNMMFCIPLTSPRVKHFKSNDDFKKKNGRNLNHFSWYYLAKTDSIAKLDQMRVISSSRIIGPYKINQENQVITKIDYEKIKIKLIKYINKILS